MQRLTQSQCETLSDEALLVLVLSDRLNKLNREGFLSKRLTKIRKTLADKPLIKPLMIATIEGGVLQSVKSSIDVDFKLIDYDNLEDESVENAAKEMADDVEALEAESESLPHEVF